MNNSTKKFTILALFAILGAGIFSASEIQSDVQMQDNSEKTKVTQKALNPSEDPSICRDPEAIDFDVFSEPDSSIICMPDPQFRKFVNDRYIGKGEVDDEIYYKDVRNLGASNTGTIKLYDNYGITDITGIGALNAERAGFKTYTSKGNDIESFEPITAYKSASAIEYMDGKMTPELFNSVAKFPNLKKIKYEYVDFSDIPAEDFVKVFKDKPVSQAIIRYSDGLDAEKMQTFYDQIYPTLTYFLVDDIPEMGQLEFYEDTPLKTLHVAGSVEDWDISKMPQMKELTFLELVECGVTQESANAITKEKFPNLRNILLSGTSAIPAVTFDENPNHVYDFSFMEPYDGIGFIGKGLDEVIELEPTVVTDTPEISYEFNPGMGTGFVETDSVPLKVGWNKVEVPWEYYFDDSTEVRARFLSGVFIQDVYYQKSPVASVEDYAMDEVSTDSGFTMSDEEIQTAMKYKVIDSGSSKGDDMTIELSSTEDKVTPLTIDYTTPGDYPVYFFSTNEDGLTTVQSATFTINDLKPKITTSKEQITVKQDSSSVDLISEFNAVATEIDKGDLTSEIKVRGIVNYSKPGQYEIKFTVVDDEGNKAQKDGKVIVEERDTVIVPGDDFTASKTATPAGDGSSKVNIGDDIEYQIAVTAKSDIDGGVTIVDPVSDNLEVDQSSIEVKLEDDVITTTTFDEDENQIESVISEDITKGEKVELTFNTTVVAEEDGKVENTATVKSNDPVASTSKTTNTTVHYIGDDETVPPTDGGDVEVSSDDSKDDSKIEQGSNVAMESKDDSTLASTGSSIQLLSIVAVSILMVVALIKRTLKE